MPEHRGRCGRVSSLLLAGVEAMLIRGRNTTGLNAFRTIELMLERGTMYVSQELMSLTCVDDCSLEMEAA